MSNNRRVHVFGPAYLDRVLEADRALAPPGSPPLDQSVDGVWTFGSGLIFRDPDGASITVELPDDWPGPVGTVTLDRALGIDDLSVRARSWHDDLGGMGAGFALALDGTLVSALGGDDDPMSRAVASLLDRANIRQSPLRVVGASADWTLLVTSGPNGDKLPVGFRGCHAAIQAEQMEDALVQSGPCDLRVVAALPNRLSAQALRAPGAPVRFFAPTTRNMIDGALPLARFAEWVDIFCCNRREWESLEDREQVAWQVSILAVTDGPSGSVVRFTTPQGEAGTIVLPAFPRTTPPKDTNRAGESYAATLIATLLDAGWSNGVSDPELIRHAALRASAAAALTLDRKRFGFPSPQEIDVALAAGRVDATDGALDDPRYNAVSRND